MAKNVSATLNYQFGNDFWRGSLNAKTVGQVGNLVESGILSKVALKVKVKAGQRILPFAKAYDAMQGSKFRERSMDTLNNLMYDEFHWKFTHWGGKYTKWAAIKPSTMAWRDRMVKFHGGAESVQSSSHPLSFTGLLERATQQGFKVRGFELQDTAKAEGGELSFRIPKIKVTFKEPDFRPDNDWYFHPGGKAQSFGDLIKYHSFKARRVHIRYVPLTPQEFHDTVWKGYLKSFPSILQESFASVDKQRSGHRASRIAGFAAGKVGGKLGEQLRKTKVKGEQVHGERQLTGRQRALLERNLRNVESEDIDPSEWS
jgi:hypothetical protein